MKLITLLLALASLTPAAFANEYVYKPLTVPKASDLVAFSNGLPPATGKRTVWNPDAEHAMEATADNVPVSLGSGRRLPPRLHFKCSHEKNLRNLTSLCHTIT